MAWGSKDVDNAMDAENGHIEVEQLNGLIAAAGPDGVRDIFDAFWRTSEELLDLLSTQVSGGDLALAAGTAHSLRGMAANVGASILSATATDLEIACQNADANAADDHVVKARADYAAARIWLKDHLQKAG